jgi:hypothetical protein
VASILNVVKCVYGVYCCIFVGGGASVWRVCMHCGERALDYMLHELCIAMCVHAERARVWRAFDMLYLCGRYIDL